MIDERFDLENEEQGDSTISWTMPGIGIAAEVLYNPHLTQTDKFLFGFIQNLAHRAKGCTASNSYLAKLMFVKEQTISNSVRELARWKYITIDYNKKKYPFRSIFLNPKREEMYSELVKYFYDNFKTKNTEALLSGLYSSITRIIQLYNLDYNKENKEYNKELNNSSSKEEEENDSDESLASANPPSLIKINRRNKITNKRALLNSNELHPNKPIKEKTPLQATDVIKDIFEFWKEQNLFLPKEGTKSYNDCIKKVKGLLNGRLFKDKYSVEQIKDSILNFSFAALDNDFEPSDILYKKQLAKKRIGDFIYCQFSKSKEKSLFLYYLNNKPKPIKSKEVVEDKYPVITNRLKKFYREEVLGKVKTDFTQKDENCFRISAIKLKDFYKNNSSRFNKYMTVHDANLSDWLFEAIKADCKDEISMVSPGWFASNTTFNRRLPAYLFRQNILEELSKSSPMSNIFKNDDLQIEY
jgi:hypothetical protein